MNQVFGSAYADVYDSLYADKDYVAECDLVEAIFRQYGNNSIHSVLDLGCGTGNYAFPLWRRGYEVLGIERSASMLLQAKEKFGSVADQKKIRFQQGDIKTVQIGRRFDAALMMFAVLGYQLENADVLAALKSARQHLTEKGLLIFDVWFGPSVLHQRPTQRAKVSTINGEKVLRFSSSKLNVMQHNCSVNLRVWRLSGDRLLSETEEVHLMRYFFPQELQLFLECAGFALVRLGAFPEVHKEPDETTWNVLVVAQAA
jgi:SAM-dependent methyltransferase